jgi:hypothetical protein
MTHLVHDSNSLSLLERLDLLISRHVVMNSLFIMSFYFTDDAHFVTYVYRPVLTCVVGRGPSPVPSVPKVIKWIQSTAAW